MADIHSHLTDLIVSAPLSAALPEHIWGRSDLFEIIIFNLLISSYCIYRVYTVVSILSIDVFA